MKRSKQEEIRDTVDFACRLKPEDLVWKPIYPNNILSNGIEGCYALVLRKDSDGRVYGRKYSILFQKEEDPEHPGEGIQAPHARTELYILMEKGYCDVCGPLDYPEPAEGGHSPLSQSEQENTFHSCASMTTAALSGPIPHWSWQRSGRLCNSARCSAMPCPACSRMRSKRRAAE